MRWRPAIVIPRVRTAAMMRGDIDKQVGDVTAFPPPGDSHRVHNTTDATAVSIHIYGIDARRTGSSVRRYYD